MGLWGVRRSCKVAKRTGGVRRELWVSEGDCVVSEGDCGHVGCQVGAVERRCVVPEGV